MTSFQNLLTSGHAWLFVPSAVLLGALHGMEPGHSKTMMAAFIISIRGTVRQAVLLGLSATASHTAVIWGLALVGLHYAGRFKVEDTEAYFQLATGLIVIVMAAWMFWRIRREKGAPHVHHHHGDESRVFALQSGAAELSIFEDGIPPCFRLRFRDVPLPAPERVTLVTTRPDGTTQSFAFRQRESFLESTSAIPEPHEFSLTLVVPDTEGDRTLTTVFAEHHHADGEPDDEHARAHAAELERRFANRRVTTWQIVLFGLTGGLLPCPSAFAVLLVCLQLKEFALGFALVLAFSVGLALTLVGVGTLAALSVKHATKKLTWLGPLTRRLPYASCAVLAVIGCILALQALRHLPK